MSDKEPIPTSEYWFRCKHGKLYGDCNPCDLAADLAYDEFCKETKPLLLIHEQPDPAPTDTP